MKGRFLMISYPLIVNRDFPLSPHYIPDSLIEPCIPFLAPAGDERRFLDANAAQAVQQLFSHASCEGFGLMAISGYRSYKRQTVLYEDALKRKSDAVAPPGTSEHQTGLALDISCSSIMFELEETFADTPEGKWLKRHAPLHGFILRYPKGKETITGYPYEPWHIRYIGKTLALYLSLTGLTLEEYHQLSL